MFLHPWAIVAGIAALGLPIVIHKLTRPRPTPFFYSTIRFVLEVIHHRRARSRLRDVLILSLRVLAIALLGAAFARPFFGAQQVVESDSNCDAVRVVIVDQSQSMSARHGGVELFERARAVAADYLTGRSGLGVNLILAGASAHAVFDAPSSNVAALRDELSRATPKPERIDVNEAFKTAADSLARSSAAPEARRELVIVSDLQRSNFSMADFSVLPKDVKIQIESVSPKTALGNIAVLNVGPKRRPEMGHDLPIEVEIANYSPIPRDLDVQIALGDNVQRIRALCGPDSRITVSTSLAPTSDGWQRGEARLLNAEDALPADDSRPFAVQVQRAPVYGMVTREIDQNNPCASYFLDRALMPAKERGAGNPVRVVRLSAEQLDLETLGPIDLVVVANPGKLSEETTKLLASLLRRGKPIFYVIGETVDATNLALLADATGADLQLPVTFAPTLPGRVAVNSPLAEIRNDRGPFRVFGDRLAELVRSLHIRAPLVSQRAERGLTDDVIASYADGNACLVRSRCGDGVLTILNADLSQSNLPVSPGFVPMIAEIVDDLLQHRRPEPAAPCGEPFSARLVIGSQSITNLRVAGVDGKTLEAGEFVSDKSGALWKWDSPDRPGVISIYGKDGTHRTIAFAAPAEESDLRSLDSLTMKDRLAGGREIGYRAAADKENRIESVWVWLATACSICVILEMATLHLFRS
ncbi:MAG: BatA and WFA domain-containing protein [Planctomycetes bacterium]|nr:BatA and WFA domain-containing protein [Planctomycetota bacterium]